jgi:hypothetical protein
MIKLERTSVMNFENAIRGARNPMNSWDRMDSYYDKNGNFILGENDLSLAKRLAKAGSDHRKFLRQIFVSVDITAPLYWWKEFDTYKVGTTANSCSTMHKIHAKEFSLDDFSHENMISNMGETFEALDALCLIVDLLNQYRNSYNETKEKRYWYSMIQLLPSSYNQMRTVTLTYENLINIYHARRHHKLTEWHVLCDLIETLPYAKELICGDGE